MTVGHRDYLTIEFTSKDEARFRVFIARIAKLIKGGRTGIIIHFLNDVEFDSENLRLLHRLLKMARFRLADIRIVVPSLKMRETFLLTRLDIYTRIYDSLEEAKKEKGFIPLIQFGSVAAICALFLLYSRTIQWLVFSWRIDPYYSHGFLVAAASLFLLWKRRVKIGSPVSYLSRQSFVLLSAGLVLYLAGYFGRANFLLGYSLVFFLLGAVLLLYGKHVYRQVSWPIALLLFAVPIPRLDEAASFLQHHTATWTTRIVSFFGLEAYSVGVNVFFGDSHIVIDAPCSGLRSLMALLFVGALFVGLLQAAPSKKVLILASIIPVGIFANLMRITLLIVIASAFGLKAAMFYFHYFSGLLCFAIALSILFAEKGLLKCTLETA